ncbi:hypothetical protein SDC9_59263 [bioreactor metagenome]|uniref:DUF4180 domain-containing protein n=1 Tax=bioreactor metagenome TaxID=1076179 RepID=A0A644XAW4_9ZZZZ
MDIRTTESLGQIIAVIDSPDKLIVDAQSALDLMATVRYENDCNRVAINKAAIAEDFFVLSSGLAGEILQKFVNYRMKLAIIGDFGGYTSKPLKDFIYESNKGCHIFFVPSEEDAVKILSAAQ